MSLSSVSKISENRPKDALIPSQSDVCIVTFFGRSQDLNFKHNTKHITVVYFQSYSPNMLLESLKS